MDSVPQKQCIVCKQFFPPTTEYFYAHKEMKARIHNECKACQCKRSKVTRENRIAIPPPEGALKRCSKCGVEKPATPEYFQARKGTSDGLYQYCKPCRSASRHEKSRPEYMQQYHQSHREEWRVIHRNRRARVKAVQGTHTATQIAEQLKRQKYRCYYAACGFAKFPKVKENGEWKYAYHIEHTYPISRVAGTDIPANDMSYLVLSCEPCNHKKKDKFPWEWAEGGRLL